MTSLSYIGAIDRVGNGERVFIVTDNHDIVERVWVPAKADVSMIFDDWIEAYDYVLKFKEIARKNRIYGLDPVMFSTSELMLFEEKTSRAAPIQMFIIEEILWYHGSLGRIRAAYDRDDDYDTMIRSLSAHT